MPSSMSPPATGWCWIPSLAAAALSSPPSALGGVAMGWKSSRSLSIPPSAAGRPTPGDTPGVGLPAADGGIDKERLDFQPIATPPGALGGDDSAAAAKEGIQHQPVAGGDIEDGIGDQRHRFDRRVQRQQVTLLGGASEAIQPGVVPHVAAVAAKPAEGDVVAVRRLAMLVDEHQLMLAAVEGAHDGVLLHPDAKVLLLGVDLAAGGLHLVQVTPVHADKVQRAWPAVAGGEAERGDEKGGVGLRRHLAHRH